MAKKPGIARLKVFTARIGFYDYVVAAPSQKAALAAWDVSANLFAQGAAQVTKDAAAIAAAMEEPGVPVRRKALSKVEFERAGSREVAKTGPATAKVREKAKLHRSKLVEAERALKAFDADMRKQTEALRAERDVLDAKELRLRTGLAARRNRLQAQVEAARKALQHAESSN